MNERLKGEQEPVAWVSESESTKQFVEGRPRRVWWECNTGVGQPFYTAPPRKPWVGLTDEQKKEATAICKASWHSWAVDPIALCNYVEAKLKEKNTTIE